MDPYERDYQPNAIDPPSTIDDLETAFKNSAHAKALEQEIADYRTSLKSDQKIFEEFERRVQQSKRRTKDVYTVSFASQVWSLVARQFFLKWQDKYGHPFYSTLLAAKDIQVRLDCQLCHFNSYSYCSRHRLVESTQNERRSIHKRRRYVVFSRRRLANLH